MVLIALGLIKKVAHRRPAWRARWSIRCSACPQAYAAPDVLLAAYAYAAQIYCDFSGYTDIAIGVALLIGFVFPQNFRSPYRATSFRDFWRRWHITLSRFLRDFLYIPLGGNRGGTAAHRPQPDADDGARRPVARRGLGLRPLGRAARRRHGHRAPVARQALKPPPVWLRWAIVFHVVVLGWVLFRAESLSLAGDFFARLVEPGPATLFTPAVVLAVAAVVGFQLLPERPLERLRERVADFQPVPLAASLALVVVVVGSTVPSQGVPPFIYFQF